VLFRPVLVARLAIIAASLALGVACGDDDGDGGTAVPTTDAADVAPSEPTTNELIPEGEDLSDCIGTLQRPGCGSEERSSLGTTLVFVAMGLGLAFIGWRITVGVRAREPVSGREDVSADVPPADPSRTPPSR